MWGLIMLLFMVAQLPGLIPHKLWASPHESTTTNHPTLRLRDLSSLEKGLPCLDKNASPRQDAPAPGMIPTRVAAAECHPSPTSFRLSCQQDHAGDSRSPTAPASCFEYWTQSRFLHHWVTSRSIPHFGFGWCFLGKVFHFGHLPQLPRLLGIIVHQVHQLRASSTGFHTLCFFGAAFHA